ncbi:protein ATP6V1FNB [Trichosurus vulpecula]|uniref:protein ATP6V1FNB n=1 Tax=Trichosurus vulpecula TaxID=9337 RepID=UPI00186B272F|nr:protein ATP6V1FNB [Trichosurus vulpecula]
MRDLLSTRNQACWTELIEKEAYSRAHWRLKFAHKYPRVPGPRKKLQVPFLSPAPDPCPLPPISPSRMECSEKRTSPEGAGVQSLQEGDKKGQMEDAMAEPLLPEMRPATPKTGQLLYQGISQEGKGRLLYLQARWQQKPEDKFRYPVLSSWDYGWGIGDGISLYPKCFEICWDSMKEAKAPVHARSRLIRDTFYFRNGVFHQPSRSDQRL